MRSLIILCTLILSAPAWGTDIITADEALAAATDSVNRTTSRGDPVDVSVLCKSAGHGSFRMMVSQSCGGTDTFTTNVWLIKQATAFWINEESTSESECGYASDEYFAYFVDDKELRKAKNQLSKVCRELLSTY